MLTIEPLDALAEEGAKVQKQPAAEAQFRMHIVHGNGLKPGVPLNSNAELEDYLDYQTQSNGTIFKVS